MIGINEIREITSKHGNDFFTFDETQFRKNFDNLNTAFSSRYPNFSIGYSYKTNYTPYLCKIVDELGGYAEIVSEMELELALSLGVQHSRIIYNGPSKSKSSLVYSLINGVIVNLDSEREFHILESLARANPTNTFKIAIRCNFLLNGDESRFGLDVDGQEFLACLDIIKRNCNISLSGLHCHFPHRALDTYAIRVKKIVELIDKYFEQVPEFINIGGGLYSSMPKELADKLNIVVPTFEEYAEVICRPLLERFDKDNLPKLFIEPGTALVADTFKYYCEVISVKKFPSRYVATSRGSIFVISPTARSKNLPVKIHSVDGSCDTVADMPCDIAGFTCIESDYLTLGIPYCVKEGDYLEYSNVGSYSVVMKPPFILPAPPVLLIKDGQISVLKRRESNSDVFELFNYDKV